MVRGSWGVSGFWWALKWRFTFFFARVFWFKRLFERGEWNGKNPKKERYEATFWELRGCSGDWRGGINNLLSWLRISMVSVLRVGFRVVFEKWKWESNIDLGVNMGVLWWSKVKSKGFLVTTLFKVCQLFKDLGAFLRSVAFLKVNIIFKIVVAFWSRLDVFMIEDDFLDITFNFYFLAPP